MAEADVDFGSVKVGDAPLEANVESSDDSGSEVGSLDGFDVLTIDRAGEEGCNNNRQQQTGLELPKIVVDQVARQMSNGHVQELLERFESLQKRCDDLQAQDDEKTALLSTVDNKLRNTFSLVGILQKRLTDAESLGKTLQEKMIQYESSCTDAKLEIEKLREGTNKRFDGTDKQLTGVQHIVLELGGTVAHYSEIGKRDMEKHAMKLDEFRQIHHVDLENLSSEITGLKATVESLAAADKAAVPVFAASRATQNKTGEFVTYSHLEFNPKEDLGAFDKGSGLFTVKTAGMYLFLFNGLYSSASGSTYIDLRVNGIKKARSCARDSTGKQYGTLAVSALLKLEVGDQVGVFLRKGILCESEGLCTRFVAVHFGD